MAIKIGSVEYLSVQEAARVAAELSGQPCAPVTIRVACRLYQRTEGRYGLKGEKFTEIQRPPWWIKRTEIQRWLDRRRVAGNPDFTAAGVAKARRLRRQAARARQRQESTPLAS